MAKFVAISGPASTGKTSLVENLSVCPELSSSRFSPDLFNVVWSDLVNKGLFQKYDEIIKDSEYVCVYLVKIIEYYEKYIECYKDKKGVVVLDCCWIDILVYALLNMWYTRPIKSLQEEILSKLMKFYNSVDRVYLTSFDESKQSKQKYRSEYQIYSVKSNRPLEIQYYNLVQNFKDIVVLPSSDQNENTLFIIEDMKKLGYLG